MFNFCSPWRLVSKVLKAAQENIEQAEKTSDAASNVHLVKQRASGSRVVPINGAYTAPRRRDSDAALG